MAQILKPPAPLVWDTQLPSIFLAGSIEQGRAEDWQTRVEQQLADIECVILNPRRDGWDASWEQRARHAQFRGQVEWELEALERAALILLYLDPATHAPISLLELGLHARSGRMLVGCPDGYWRKGNVEIVCERYGVPLFDDFDSLLAAVRARYARHNSAR